MAVKVSVSKDGRDYEFTSGADFVGEVTFESAPGEPDGLTESALLKVVEHRLGVKIVEPDTAVSMLHARTKVQEALLWLAKAENERRKRGKTLLEVFKDEEEQRVPVSPGG